MQVDIWSDIACPWCFIGKRRFERGASAFAHADEVRVRWRSYQLDPTIPDHYDGTESDYLMNRKGMSRERVRAMLAAVGEQAAGEGLDYDFDALVVANSLPGHRLLHMAALVDDEAAAGVNESLLSGHFERGLDIGAEDVLVGIGAEHGLTGDVVRAGLADPEIDALVQADFAAARQFGVTSVPFFVIGGTHGVSGAQPPSVFTKALEQAWDKR